MAKLRLQVRVQTKSSQPGISETGLNKYKVRVGSPPEKGKANEEMIKILSDYLGVAKSSLQIVRGIKGREKIIEIGL